MMEFYEVVRQVLGLLQQKRRVTYRGLKLQFKLDDETLEALKEEILYSQPQVLDDEGRGLIWTSETDSTFSPVQSMHQGEESESRFYAVLPAIIAFLQREERVTYRTLKHVFGLNDGILTDICEELHLRHLAIDEGGKVLVWTGKTQPNVTPAISEPSPQVARDTVEVATPVTPSRSSLVTETEPQANGPTALSEPQPTDTPPDESAVVPEPTRSAPEAERRQLTVMFCDLVGSTDLSTQLDPEDLREVIRAYQETVAKVIQQYDGHIAQYLGDGLLIYFGWPQAHENDTERAVYTGLEIPQAIDRLNARLEKDYGVQLAVRIGIHTGPVVVGEMGGGGRHENLALGETPNISARLEGLAKPNTVVISPATAQLVQRSFVLEELGLHELKGVAEPMMLYAVVGPREVEHDEHEEMLAGGFDALVGRDEEIGLLLRRWEQSKESQGQVVLISW
jgi:class 3 adenylate cyclase